MDVRQFLILTLLTSIVSTVFGFGLAATPADLFYLLRRPALLLRSVFAAYVVMPAVAVVLVHWFHFPRTTEVVLVSLALSPVPPLLPNRQGKAGGQVTYGLALTVTLSLFAIVVVPVAVAFLSWILERPFAIGPGAVAAVVLKTTIAPLAAGMAVRAIWPSTAARLVRPAALVGNLLLPLAALAVIVGTFPAVLDAVGNGTVLVLVVFIVTGFAVGHVLAGPRPDQAVVLALATACRHPALALAIATATHPGEPFGPTIVLYLILNVIVAIPYVRWLRGRVTVLAT